MLQSSGSSPSEALSSRRPGIFAVLITPLPTVSLFRRLECDPSLSPAQAPLRGNVAEEGGLRRQGLPAKVRRRRMWAGGGRGKWGWGLDL